MPRRIDVPERVVLRVDEPVLAERIVERAGVSVLRNEAADCRVVVSAAGPVEARLPVVEVAGECEAVLACIQGGRPGGRRGEALTLTKRLSLTVFCREACYEPARGYDLLLSVFF